VPNFLENDANGGGTAEAADAAAFELDQCRCTRVVIEQGQGIGKGGDRFAAIVRSVYPNIFQING